MKVSSPVTPKFIAPEFSHIVDVRLIEAKPIVLTANADECAALARRFDLVRINSFVTTLTLSHDKPAILAKGHLRAKIIQSCAISAEELPVTIDEPLNLRFVPADAAVLRPDEELEISLDDCDEIPFEGGRFDLGEELAQTLAVLIDPFITGPKAQAVRAKGILASAESTGPFAALAALKKG